MPTGLQSLRSTVRDASRTYGTTIKAGGHLAQERVAIGV